MASRSTLAVILHADVVGSTALVQRDENLAHDRIQEAFKRLSEDVVAYAGKVHELRGDALVAQFDRASDAASAALRFQARNRALNQNYKDEIVPVVRIGIALGEVVIADGTVTGAGVVLAQRLCVDLELPAIHIYRALRHLNPSPYLFFFDFDDFLRFLYEKVL